METRKLGNIKLCIQLKYEEINRKEKNVNAEKVK